MKIKELQGKPQGLPEVAGKDERRISETKETAFQSQLRKVEDDQLDERIRKLVDRIIEQGKKLGDRVDIHELKVYKKMVAEFLGEAVGNSHRFSKENFLDRRGRYKVYANVKKVNTQLDELTKEVLSSEKDKIKILQRLDDIRGLILDMVM